MFEIVFLMEWFLLPFSFSLFVSFTFSHLQFNAVIEKIRKLLFAKWLASVKKLKKSNQNIFYHFVSSIFSLRWRCHLLFVPLPLECFPLFSIPVFSWRCHRCRHFIMQFLTMSLSIGLCCCSCHFSNKNKNKIDFCRCVLFAHVFISFFSSPFIRLLFKCFS